MKIRELFENIVVDERIIDPLELQQRVARRYGKKIKYGTTWDSVEKGKHIPLTGYNASSATSLHNYMYKIDKVLGIWNSDPEIKEAGIKKLKSFYINEILPIKSLIPTQPFNRYDNKEDEFDKWIISTYGIDNNINITPKNVQIARFKNKNFILDGHHRVMAAMMRGDKTIPVTIYDIDSILKSEWFKNLNRKNYAN